MAKKPHDPTFSIDEVVTSSTGEVFSIEKPLNGEELVPTVIEDERLFSYDTYSQEVHFPTALPRIDVTSLKNEYPRCLDMPIRLSGDTEYRVPDEWVGLVPLIKQIAANEHAHNRNWEDYYTYITVDCKMVEPDEQQRHGGLHVDGFQGERIDPKTKITRNYVMTTNGGTRFYRQRFVVADPAVFNVFQGFDIQADGFEIAEENLVYFMDAYTVHESGIASRKGMRTFLRMTYDLKKFDREGNTRNRMLDYDWDMVARKVHETVRTPNYVDLENSPYYGE